MFSVVYFGGYTHASGHRCIQCHLRIEGKDNFEQFL